MKKRSIVLMLIYIFYEKKINSTTVDLFFHKKQIIQSYYKKCAFIVKSVKDIQAIHFQKN